MYLNNYRCNQNDKFINKVHIQYIMEKEIILTTRVTSKEAELIKSASEKEYQSVSAYIRKCVMVKTNEVLKDEN